MRAYNFSAGPAILPEEVLKEAAAELVDYQGTGMSIMEMSHRGKEYSAIHDECIANIKELLNIPEGYSVLFMTGGASTQFPLIPMNLLGEGQTADYTDSGAWASKAIKEAKMLGNINVAADCGKEIPTRVPAVDELNLTDGAAYLHITSNETISGAQWKVFPEHECLIADMSSDILSRPLDVSKFGLIYAGSQKNLGPAGITLVIIKDELAERCPDTVPTIMRYKTHIANNSLYNTVPTFPVYMLCLVTRWLKALGGLEGMQKLNTEKAGKLYDCIDGTDFYTGTAVPEFRSNMNVTWRLANEDLEPVFIEEASKRNLKTLKGHRSVGGIRASIYNAFPEEGVDALISFMAAFEAKHS
ncbi:3-phosphoserine/phosphohydroxythreonine transaminase [Pontiella sulfatireligans]|uniref:Phosphoserine aminotransferase n=1 Tax=Pontiella sulfatireligans TaxID=2750658 RepID=A0A6C2ULR6_9BACT|nr:3-phosphoserine/phosphohydroxythreonine transaminase [Pontiella sulfatireligans]VGO21202.1 Phosphoserine aminotransferase [Pontiella sulfatireligans]